MAGLPVGQSFTVDALPAWFQALGGSSPTFLGTQPQCGDMSRNAHNNKNCKKEIMLANLANMAKMTILPQSPTRQSTKQYRGPIKVGESGEFGKYGENDNFATIANEAKHKAVKGPHKSWRKQRIWQLWRK